MPAPQTHPHLLQIKRVATIALIAGLAIMSGKFALFMMTNSAAVLSDAMESIVNIIAAGFMLYTLWIANRPSDRDHPYGHGKVEFMAIGLEGWLILLAGLVIAVEAIRRFIDPPPLTRLELGAWLLGGMAVFTGALATYVWLAGRKYRSLVLAADGKHLLTDCLSTIGVTLGVVLVQLTKIWWLDPLVALVMACVILSTSWKLMWQSIDGLMDRRDPADEATVRAILDEQVREGTIKGYHKVRTRHSGSFHWVEMHLQVDPEVTVREGHEVASRIEGKVEAVLRQANATAHVEPFEPDKGHAKAPPSTNLNGLTR